MSRKILICRIYSQYTETVLTPEEVKQIREVLEGYEFDVVFNRHRFESHV